MILKAKKQGKREPDQHYYPLHFILAISWEGKRNLMILKAKSLWNFIELAY